jgi:hypothetical protein
VQVEQQVCPVAQQQAAINLAAAAAAAGVRENVTGQMLQKKRDQI